MHSLLVLFWSAKSTKVCVKKNLDKNPILLFASARDGVAGGDDSEDANVADMNTTTSVAMSGWMAACLHINAWYSEWITNEEYARTQTSPNSGWLVQRISRVVSKQAACACTYTPKTIFTVNVASALTWSLLGVRLDKLNGLFFSGCDEESLSVFLMFHRIQ